MSRLSLICKVCGISFYSKAFVSDTIDYGNADNEHVRFRRKQARLMQSEPECASLSLIFEVTGG